jgi:transcription initiation factor IIF auxiliary subunit
MSIQFANYSMRAEIKYEQAWFDWCVFVAAEKPVLNRIAQVHYQLHPTFPNPIRITDDRNHRFPLITNGWGEFSLSITVALIDGTSETSSYWVRLRSDAWPKKRRPTKFETNEEERVYDVLAEGQFRWRKLNTIERRTGLKTDVIFKALERLESTNLARKAEVRSIDQQEMWGATAIVGIMPEL